MIERRRKKTKSRNLENLPDRGRRRMMAAGPSGAVDMTSLRSHVAMLPLHRAQKFQPAVRVVLPRAQAPVLSYTAPLPPLPPAPPASPPRPDRPSPSPPPPPMSDILASELARRWSPPPPPTAASRHAAAARHADALASGPPALAMSTLAALVVMRASSSAWRWLRRVALPVMRSVRIRVVLVDVDCT